MINIYNYDLFLGIKKRGTQIQCAAWCKKYNGGEKLTHHRINRIINGKLKPTNKEKRLLANYARKPQKYLFGSK